MNKPVIVKTMSPNNNPWWISYHMSLLCYEVQVSPKTKNVLIGFGPKLVGNTVMPCSELLQDEEMQNYIRNNLSEEVLAEVLRKCTAYA